MPSLVIILSIRIISIIVTIISGGSRGVLIVHTTYYVCQPETKTLNQTTPPTSPPSPHHHLTPMCYQSANSNNGIHVGRGSEGGGGSGTPVGQSCGSFFFHFIYVSVVIQNENYNMLVDSHALRSQTFFTRTQILYINTFDKLIIQTNYYATKKKKKPLRKTIAKR